MAPNHTGNSGYKVLSDAIQSHKRIKGMFVFRDPRDVLISMVHSSTSGIWPEGHIDGTLNNMGSDEERYLWVLNNGGHGKSAFNNVFAGYYKYLQSEDFLNVRYEDLVGLRRGGNVRTQVKLLNL
jgi:hypothetical protein